MSPLNIIRCRSKWNDRERSAMTKSDLRTKSPVKGWLTSGLQYVHDTHSILKSYCLIAEDVNFLSLLKSKPQTEKIWYFNISSGRETEHYYLFDYTLVKLASGAHTVQYMHTHFRLWLWRIHPGHFHVVLSQLICILCERESRLLTSHQNEGYVSTW